MAAAGAPRPPAQSQPAEAPAAEEGPRLDSPLDAVRAYAEACRDADVAKLAAVTHAPTDIGQEALALISRSLTASAALERAADERFGPGQGEAINGRIFMWPTLTGRGRDMLENFPDAEVEQREGDAAFVGIEPVGGVYTRRVGGKWKVALGAAEMGEQQAEPGQADQDQDWGRQMLTVIATESERLAREIETGKYETADQAVEAAGRRLDVDVSR